MTDLINVQEARRFAETLIPDSRDMMIANGARTVVIETVKENQGYDQKKLLEGIKRRVAQALQRADKMDMSFCNYAEVNARDESKFNKALPRHMKEQEPFDQGFEIGLNEVRESETLAKGSLKTLKRARSFTNDPDTEWLQQYSMGRIAGIEKGLKNGYATISKPFA